VAAVPWHVPGFKAINGRISVDPQCLDVATSVSLAFFLVSPTNIFTLEGCGSIAF